MSTAAATDSRQPSAQQVVRTQLDKMQDQFKVALPAHIPVERFMRVVMTAIQSNPYLLSADRASLFEASTKAAQDGLLPDGREGALVIYRVRVKGRNGGQDRWIDKVQWMPMIGGLLKKIRNSGELLSIGAYVVYDNDDFTYVLGDEERIEHRPALRNRGKPYLVYAIAKTKDGGIYREVMTVEEVEKVRAVSRAKDSGVWVQWWEEMAKKTVIRRLAKRLPMSADLDDMIRRDDALYDLDGAEEKARLAARGRRSLAGKLDMIAASLPAYDHGPVIDSSIGEIDARQSDAGAAQDQSDGVQENGSTGDAKPKSAAARKGKAPDAGPVLDEKQEAIRADLIKQGGAEAAKGCDALDEFFMRLEPAEQVLISADVRASWLNLARSVDAGTQS